MNNTEEQMTEQESLDLIAAMIRKAKDVCHNTGISSIMWGSLITFCSLERLAEIHFGYTLPFDIYLLTFIAVFPQIFISRREKKLKNVKTYDSVYQQNIWLAFGICIFLLIFFINVLFASWEPAAKEFLAATGKKMPFSAYEYIAPLFLMLYGIPTFITGVSMKFKPMIAGSILCWVCCLITMFTSLQIDLLLTAVSAIFAWLIPGILMERDYRRAKTNLAQIHV